MYKLLEDYLKNSRGFSELEVTSFTIKGNICNCYYDYYHNGKEKTIRDNQEQVDIWILLDFIYIELKQKQDNV